MASNRKVRKGKGKTTEGTQEVLQAVVIAETFRETFAPVTFELPEVLVPLVNVPILEYSLEWLAASGVGEIIVFVTSHFEAMQTFLRGWEARHTDISLQAVFSQSCIGEGDVLRAVDQKGIIRGDFILVLGGVVCNLNLGKALAVHRAQREGTQQTVMTVILKKLSRLHKLRRTDEEEAIVVDAHTGRLFQCGACGDDGQVLVALEHFGGASPPTPTLKVHSNLYQCGVYICAPEILSLFTDNFDWANVRRECIRGILRDDITGNRIHTHIITEEHGAIVTSPRAYDLISRQIIARWLFPWVVDSNWTTQSSYKYRRTNVYKERGVVVPRTSSLSSGTVIGGGTTIGSETSIDHSVVGRNCRIGRNVAIVGSYLWDQVVVEDNTTIREAILCAGTRVMEGAIVEKGCILTEGVIVGQKFHVPAFSRMTKTRIKVKREEDAFSESDSGEEMIAASPELSSSVFENMSALGGIGFFFRGSDEEYIRGAIGYGMAPGTEEEEEEEEEEGDSDEEDESFGVVALSLEEVEERFMREVEETARRGVLAKHRVEDILLEVSGLRLAYDESSVHCGAGCLRAILDAGLADHEERSAILIHVKKSIKEWKALLRHFTKEEEDQLDLIFYLESFCSKNTRMTSLFTNLLQFLYEQDMLSEDAILGWPVKKRKNKGDMTFVNQAQIFIKWLEEAEEESDEEEDGEEEEEEEEEEG